MELNAHVHAAIDLFTPFHISSDDCCIPLCCRLVACHWYVTAAVCPHCRTLLLRMPPHDQSSAHCNPWHTQGANSILMTTTLFNTNVCQHCSPAGVGQCGWWRKVCAYTRQHNRLDYTHPSGRTARQSEGCIAHPKDRCRLVQYT